LHTCVHSICTIFTLPHSFPTSYPLPLVPTPSPRQNLLCPCVLRFCKKTNKNKTFCLFKIAIQGVSLWHFHVYMYYNPNWFISSIFLLFYLSPLLMVVSTYSNILYHSCIAFCLKQKPFFFHSYFLLLLHIDFFLIYILLI
jgi:hypothetical protein